MIPDVHSTMIIKWKHFPRYWPFVRGIHRSPGGFPSQRPVTRSFDVFFDLGLNDGWTNSRDAGDLRRHHAHYEVSVMCDLYFVYYKNQVSVYNGDDLRYTQVPVCTNIFYPDDKQLMM